MGVAHAHVSGVSAFGVGVVQLERDVGEEKKEPGRVFYTII